MKITISANDIYNAALKLEERGENFYLKAATAFSGEEKSLLARLAEMEKGHASTFRKMQLEAQQSASVIQLSDPESCAYLDALASAKTFDRECKPESDDTYEQILFKAMSIEKSSIFFYAAVKGLLGSKIAIEHAEMLIEEEMMHYNMLFKALSVWQNKQQDFK